MVVRVIVVVVTLSILSLIGISEAYPPNDFRCAQSCASGISCCTTSHCYKDTILVEHSSCGKNDADCCTALTKPAIAIISVVSFLVLFCCACSIVVVALCCIRWRKRRGGRQFYSSSAYRFDSEREDTQARLAGYVPLSVNAVSAMSTSSTHNG
ncbi:hypothetical protein QOT17_004837 [Balamuthia mandrillaris]